MEPVLRIAHLHKSFGRRHVIDDVSFDLFPGEVFGFLGPNGAGKTTTIKMILGFLSIDAGEVAIGGYSLRKNYEKALSGVGGIVENPEMYRDLSGLTNLTMYARLHDGVTRARIDECVALVGMQNRIHERVKKYSLGMKQRVGLAQAILHRPRLLILDEPTNGLDPAGIRELRDILRNLAHQEGVGVLISSHQLAEMELMCDRVGIISAGRLLGTRPIGELLAEAAGASVYRFEVADVDAVRASLVSAGLGDNIRGADGSSVSLACERASVPAVTQALVQAGVQIYGIQRHASSLEDAFLSLTGGGNSIA